MLAPRRILGVVLALVLMAGCAGRGTPPAGGPGAPASTVAVERFLQLAADRDYIQMGWVFGTEDGPIMREYPQSEVEQRMYAIATVLRHDSFVVGPGAPVPGRMGTAERFTVRIQDGANQYDVPFIAVRGSGGRWYVEQVDLQAVTSMG